MIATVVDTEALWQTVLAALAAGLGTTLAFGGKFLGLDLLGTLDAPDSGTVHLDGRRVNACMVLAAQCDEREVTTIEGLAAPDGTLHPVQAAFIEHDGLQCGFCTPGQVMSAVACIREGHTGSDAEIREWMSGNLCRCSAYPQIVDAVRAAAGPPARGADASGRAA